MMITLPFCDSRLHAHNKGNWRSKGKDKAVETLKSLAWHLGKAAKGPRTFQKARIHYRFFVPDNRQRDEANMIQSQKPAVDGLKKAGVFKDDCWQILNTASVTVMIDRDRPRVELVIEEV